MNMNDKRKPSAILVAAFFGLVMGLAFGLLFGLFFGLFSRSLNGGLICGLVGGPMFGLAMFVIFIVTDKAQNKRMARLERDLVTKEILFRTPGFLCKGRRTDEGVRFDDPPKSTNMLFTTDSFICMMLNGKKYTKLELPYNELEGVSFDADIGTLKRQIADMVGKGFDLTINMPDAIYVVGTTRAIVVHAVKEIMQR